MATGHIDIGKWSFTSDADSSNTGADLATSGTVSFHGTSQTATHGFQFGGRINNSSYFDDIQKYQIGTSTNATKIGDMGVSSTYHSPAISENPQKCWLAGGGAGGNDINDIRIFAFASDTTETDVGDLEATRRDGGGANGNA